MHFRNNTPKLHKKSESAKYYGVPFPVAMILRRASAVLRDFHGRRETLKTMESWRDCKSYICSTYTPLKLERIIIWDSEAAALASQPGFFFVADAYRPLQNVTKTSYLG